MPGRYAAFASAYRKARDLELNIIYGRSVYDLRDDPLGQMVLLSSLIHERAGTNPAFARYHREAVDEVLQGRRDKYAERVLNDSRFADQVWNAFVRQCDGKPNESCTKGPVAGTIRLMHERHTANWVDLLGEMTPQWAWEALQELRGVGPKLASLVLREFQTFLGPWKTVEREAWHCFQPLDRWVVRASRLCWPALKFPEGIAYTNQGYRRAAGKISSQFESLQAGMDFNMGAWFVGRYRAEILALHGCICMRSPDEDEMHHLIPGLDANRVAEAIRPGAEQLRQSQQLA